LGTFLSLYLNEAAEAAVRRMQAQSPNGVRQAEAMGGPESLGTLRVGEAIEESLQGIALVLDDDVTGGAYATPTPCTQIGQQGSACHVMPRAQADARGERRPLQGRESCQLLIEEIVGDDGNAERGRGHLAGFPCMPVTKAAGMTELASGPYIGDPFIEQVVNIARRMLLQASAYRAAAAGKGLQ
jgi:hypothetical protein